MMSVLALGLALANLEQTACVPEVRRVAALLSEYRERAALSRESKAEKSLEALHRFIFQEVGPRNPCFDSVAKAYTLGSILISEENSPETISIFRAVAHLMSKPGRIEILTPRRRHQLGRGWLELGEVRDTMSSSYRIRGGYACGTSTLYIDPELPPMNLAAVVLHELDHLFRDKLVSTAAIARMFPSRSASTVDWRSWLTLDETLAIAAGAHWQLRLGAVEGHRKGLRYLLAHVFLYEPLKSETYKGYQVLNDRNFVSLEGPLQRLWSLAGASSLRAFLDGTFLFVCGPYLCGDRNNGMPWAQTQMVWKEVSKVLGTVYQAYFPGTSWSSRDAELFRYGLLAPAADPFADWLVQGAPLAVLDELLARPSESCEAFTREAPDDASIASYVGLRLSGTDPTHPGGEAGVKGTIDVRACVKDIGF